MKILLIGAMPSENKYIIDSLKLVKTELLEGFFPLYYKKLRNKEIFLVQCYVGTINASAASVLGIQKIRPDLVIKVGCVGANSLRIKKNSLLVPTLFFHTGAWITRSYMDNKPIADSSYWQILFGDKPDQNSRKNLGGIPFIFFPDRKYNQKYKSVLKALNKKYIEAALGSGDMVIYDKRFIKNIQNKIVGVNKLWCSDNETYPIAQICYITKTAFMGIFFVASSDYDDIDGYNPKNINYQTKKTIVPIVKEFVKKV